MPAGWSYAGECAKGRSLEHGLDDLGKSMRGDLVVLFSALAAALACGEPAAAAVRLCKEPVSSVLIVRPTEQEARKEAMTALKAKAMEF